MHFVSGGAFNGKRGWVKHFYQWNDHPSFWLNGYKETTFAIDDIFNQKVDLVIIEGIEQLIKNSVSHYIEEDREKWRKIIKELKEWEKGSPNRQVVFIGSDIGQGLVPMEANDRYWRDLVGWCYQDIAKDSDRIDRVWYGIAERLK